MIVLMSASILGIVLTLFWYGYCHYTKTQPTGINVGATTIVMLIAFILLLCTSFMLP